MRRALSLLVLVSALVSCSVDVPVDVISPSKMERILYDYHRAQGMADAAEGNAAADSRYALVQQVFRKYGITEAEFDSSMVWYSGHSNYLVKMYKNIDDRLQREFSMLGMDATDDIYANLTAYGDTAVVWRSTNVCMRGVERQNIVSYNIIPDSTFMPGDTYALRFKSRFLMEEGSREGYALLMARYTNDSLASATTRIGGDMETNIQIARSALTDTAQLSQLQVVFYFPYDEGKQDKFRLWMVSSPMLIRFHHPELVAREAQDEELPDTIDALADTLAADSGRKERLTPQQLRDSHDGEHTIRVTKQKKVVMPNQNTRRRTNTR